MHAPLRPAIALTLCCAAALVGNAQSPQTPTGSIHVSWQKTAHAFPLAEPQHPAAVYLAPEDEATLGLATAAFAADIERVSGAMPNLVHAIPVKSDVPLVIVAIAGHSPLLQRLQAAGKLDTKRIEGQWESALTAVVDDPLPGIHRALIVAGSDRRGAAFALFTLSRQMGVSPWNWWADVPVPHHDSVFVQADDALQPTPSVQYRGIFLNDEDWGLRPWAAKTMDPTLHNIGPNTYNRVFELLLRLHANSLWPAMHPGTLAFNAVPENARLADAWGIVMGASHSEALLRNNVGEWSEAAPPKGNGPWNYQLNKAAMDAYWDERLTANGHYENFYTVGLRGVHDTGLEAKGDNTVKARLVEQAMAAQRAILARHVDPNLAKVPQVIWLYKESLELYRAGMIVPPDVTLGWTDDNYGYIRQLPTAAERKRPGGSGLYYHVSYWGFPHDYLWLCTTPPALMREELTKAYDHGVRRYWVLNVGDLKPAESDIDYFMQLAWNEPAMAEESQHDFLQRWFAEQLPTADSAAVADLMQRYYQLNFVRKPEFMGFNGYNDGVNRTAFNPNAWGDQNTTRLSAWTHLRDEAQALAKTLPPQYASAYFELVGYPIEAAAAMNEKFLATDRTYLDAHNGSLSALTVDTARAKAAYDSIQSLTARYNGLEGGKWQGILSDAPRMRHVFEMPAPATAQDGDKPLPASWATGDAAATLSIAATHFTRKSDAGAAHWKVLPELGISGSSIEYGDPGKLADADARSNRPWLEYDLNTTATGPAILSISLLPTFPIDSAHRLRFAAAIDGKKPATLDAGATGEWHEDTAPVWAANVLRNAAVVTLPLGNVPPGKHTVRLFYVDPGVIFEHLTLTVPGSAPAYPVPPETVPR